MALAGFTIPVLSGDAGGSETGAIAWNSGITQSSENWNHDEDTVVNWAINARCDGDRLVFDRVDLLATPPATLTTSGEPEAPGYRGALSLTSPDWKGIEHLWIDSTRFWNYSILVSDIQDNDDADSFAGYLAGVLNGRALYGTWGGQLLGDGASATDVPGSVVGTFSARSHGDSESLVGIFGAYQDLTRLLSGHGLAVGDTTVEPGESEEQGNVAISCPAGGAACAVTVRAGGTVFNDRNGGDPEFVFARPDAPIVELDGSLHVGADVAPPASGLAAGGTRHGVSVSTGSVEDGVGADQVVSYMRAHMSRSNPGLGTFSVRPVVRVAEGTSAELIEYTRRAVQLINAALPYEKRVLFSKNPAPGLSVYQDVPNGEIFVDFSPWEDWNDPDRTSGVTWVTGRRDHRYDDEAQRWEVLERRAAHIWINGEMSLTAYVRNPRPGGWTERCWRVAWRIPTPPTSATTTSGEP